MKAQILPHGQRSQLRDHATTASETSIPVYTPLLMQHKLPAPGPGVALRWHRPPTVTPFSGCPTRWSLSDWRVTPDTNAVREPLTLSRHPTRCVKRRAAAIIATAVLHLGQRQGGMGCFERQQYTCRSPPLLLHLQRSSTGQEDRTMMICSTGCRALGRQWHKLKPLLPPQPRTTRKVSCSRSAPPTDKGYAVCCLDKHPSTAAALPAFMPT